MEKDKKIQPANDSAPKNGIFLDGIDVRLGVLHIQLKNFELSFADSEGKEHPYVAKVREFFPKIMDFFKNTGEESSKS